ncbi:MAG: hypothetical protein LUH04_05310 [Clostridium sp.]|nr:hypothetical protein [Clostridium sp.]
MKRKSLLTVLFGLICCCFVASPDVAFGAAGDIQNATIRVRNVDVYGNTAKIPTLFEDSMIRWEMNVSNLMVSPVNVYLPKESTWRLSWRNAANGTIQPILWDKYNCGWTGTYTVRHGVPTMIYDLYRGFNYITFYDQNGKEFKFDSVHFTTQRNTYSAANSCVGDASGYHFPVFGAGTNYYLVCRYQGAILNVDLAGLENLQDHWALQVQVGQSSTRSAAPAISLVDMKTKSGKEAKRITTPKADKGLEKVEIKSAK